MKVRACFSWSQYRWIGCTHRADVVSPYDYSSADVYFRNRISSHRKESWWTHSSNDEAHGGPSTGSRRRQTRSLSFIRIDIYPCCACGTNSEEAANQEGQARLIILLGLVTLQTLPFNKLLRKEWLSHVITVGSVQCWSHYEEPETFVRTRFPSWRLILWSEAQWPRICLCRLMSWIEFALLVFECGKSRGSCHSRYDWWLSTGRILFGFFNRGMVFRFPLQVSCLGRRRWTSTD